MAGGTNRYITTIEQMERDAEREVDGVCSKRIQGDWLSVERCMGVNGRPYFEYRLGKTVVPREVAKNALASAQSK
jgi:hypothetical protein